MAFTSLVLVAVTSAACGRIGFDSSSAIQDVGADDWYGVDWGYRKSITIRAGQVREDLTGFALAVVMVDPDLAARARSDGSDLVFTAADGVTKLPHELERLRAGGDLAAWVAVPSVAATADTVLYLYYGNPVTTSQENAVATWSDFRAVWHMSETPTVDPVARDSTANDNDASFLAMTSTAQVVGRAGGALDFDGIDSCLTIASTPSLSFGNGASDSALTIEAWVFMRDANAFKIAAKGPAPPPLEYYFRTGDQTDDRLMMRVYDSAANYVGRRYSIGLTPRANRWVHLATTYDGSRSATGIALYVDGERVDDLDASSGVYTAMTPTASTLDVGRYVSGGNFTNGIIDDLRIAGNARSPAWIHAAYANLAVADFLTIGPEARKP